MPGNSTKERGRMVRESASREHTDPFGGRVRISRDTLDRWIRRYRAGGFDALAPSTRQPGTRIDTPVLELAVALKRENPDRTAAQVARILRGLGRLGAVGIDAAAAVPPPRPDPPARRRRHGRCSAGSKPAPRTSGGSATPCTALGSVAARPTSSRSWTTTHGWPSGIGSGSPRTPSGWPPR